MCRSFTGRKCCLQRHVYRIQSAYLMRICILTRDDCYSWGVWLALPLSLISAGIGIVKSLWTILICWWELPSDKTRQYLVLCRHTPNHERGFCFVRCEYLINIWLDKREYVSHRSENYQKPKGSEWQAKRKWIMPVVKEFSTCLTSIACNIFVLLTGVCPRSRQVDWWNQAEDIWHSTLIHLPAIPVQLQPLAISLTFFRRVWQISIFNKGNGQVSQSREIAEGNLSKVPLRNG